MSRYENVLSPARWGNLWLKNRVVMAPMGCLLGDGTGSMSAREVGYLTARAAGGTAMVIPGIHLVERTFSGGDNSLNWLDTDDRIKGIRHLAAAVHAADGRVSIQLSAGMGRNGPAPAGQPAPYSASAVPVFGAPDVLCQPLGTDQIAALVESFGQAARRVAEAGCDAIDIHGHTGYLIDQFMSAVWNQREDEYGGSLDNRMRFACELVAACKRAAPGLPISFRLSVDHHFPGGRTATESRQIAQILQRAGVDVLLADEGSYEAMDYVFPPYYLGDECMRGAAQALKGALTIPVGACGNITPENAEDILASGDAQFILIGRGLIAEPQWVNKLAAGHREQIRPCIRCNVMCFGAAISGVPLGCSVNPQAACETSRVIRPTAAPQRVVIVGAGPAGLEAARVAAERGHRVEVYDKAAQLGGVLWPAATPDFKRELRAMIAWWEGELTRLGVAPVLNHAISADSPELAGADAILVATGSEPTHPDIPGIDTAIEVIDAHLGAPLGPGVVVAGGGLSGCDLALELAEDGHHVTIVEMEDALARDMLPVNAMTLMRRLAAAGVEVLTGHVIEAIEPGAVVAKSTAGEVRIAADCVVNALGVRPNTALARELTSRGLAVTPIGDCVDPLKVGDAIHAGFTAAMAL